MWAQDMGQGAQLCLTRPEGQLAFTQPSSGQRPESDEEVKSLLNTKRNDVFM